ncbi:Gfo/Idh/MocA family oxidoreductase [Chloroflexi bacterium TSY]|nr:Gfo/Idh/MocA family oxidoreductase [Chloroflexi bacterium TSY]
MTTEKVRIGIVGVGQIGKQHVKSHTNNPNAEIVAIADINESEAYRVAEQNGIPNVYTDFRKMLERDDIEAVDICLHNNFHAPVTIAALEAGKHAHSAKPMAGAYRDAERMAQTARETGLKLHVTLRNLFHKETKAAKLLIDEGHLGKVYHARSAGHRRRGRPFVDGYGSPTFVQKENSAGGALYDMGVYHISAILHLLGNPDVLRISGKTYQEIPMNQKRAQSSGYNVEELGMGFVRLADDIVLDVIESWAMHLDKIEGSYVVGSEGGVRLNPFGYFRNIGDLGLDATTNLDLFNYRLHNVLEQGDVYDDPMTHWVAALQGRVELWPTAKLGLNTMLISEGIYLSNKLGREVTAEEVREQSVSSAIKL